jgi:hypothetical protein
MNPLPTQINKTDIVRRLHEIIDYHLFESTSWPAGGDAVSAFWRMLEEIGLTEAVAGMEDTTRFTTLGFDCGAPLASYFIGAHEPMEIPSLLERQGLIEEEEEEEAFYSLLEDGDESVFEHVEMLVRRAHRRFCGIKDVHAQSQ